MCCPVCEPRGLLCTEYGTVVWSFLGRNLLARAQGARQLQYLMQEMASGGRAGHAALAPFSCQHGKVWDMSIHISARGAIVPQPNQLASPCFRGKPRRATRWDIVRDPRVGFQRETRFTLTAHGCLAGGGGRALGK